MSEGRPPSRREFLAFGAGTAGLLLAGLPLAVPAQARPSPVRAPGPSIEAARLRPPKAGSRAKAGPARSAVPLREGKGTLRYGTPEEAGLLREHLERIDEQVEAGLPPSPSRPLYPGAVVLVARDGVVVEHEAYGYAYLYADDRPTLLPEGERVPMRRDTVFDLASVSKLFTSLAAMQLVERGQLELDAPVAGYLPPFGQNGKGGVTVRQLLVHTSGLPAWLPLYRAYATPEERIAAVYAAKPGAEPGTKYTYSDLGMITLGKLVETISGEPLDRFVARNITEPLGMADTGYNPSESRLDRIAATEYQPWTGRGMVRGEVHDENAWSLNGVAGHAGVFGTAWDLVVLSQAILNGGRYGNARILKPGTVREMLTNYNAGFPGNDHGLGFELYQHWYMDAIATPVTAGHTGFTGTSMVLNPLDGSLAVLLTNRVHPSRSWGSINPARRAVARSVARAVPVRIPGREAWFSGMGDGLNNTLDLPLDLPEGPKELRFRLFYDTEPTTDYGAAEVSTDGGATWQALAGTVSGRGESREVPDGRLTGWSGREWLDARFDLSPHAGPATLRLRYATDATSNGRGVYVDRTRVIGPGGVLFDEARPRDRGRWQSRGWNRSKD